jgi:hypothetical protein
VAGGDQAANGGGLMRDDFDDLILAFEDDLDLWDDDEER